MAFIAMFFATIFLVVVLVGLGILLIGIALDIIWGVMKHKQKKVHAVHKVFAVLLTIIGAIAGIGPLAAVGIMKVTDDIKERAEISDMPEENFVYVDNFSDIYDGFDYHGAHYVELDDYDIYPQRSHENFKEEPVGAVIEDSGDHRLIYSVENLLGLEILDIEYSKVFVDESKVDEIVDYYSNKAQYYCQVNRSDKDFSFDVEDIDSGRVREIRSLVREQGMAYLPDGLEYSDSDGYMLFYSIDDMVCEDFTWWETDDGLLLASGARYLYLDDGDAGFIRSIVDK